MKNRTFWSLTLALLAVMAAVQVTTALEENQTFDEAVHMLAGYSYLKTGRFRLNPEHPPLGKILNALPLVLFLQPELPTKDPRWPDGDLYDLGEAFLYRNRIPADRMLFASRLVTIALTLLLGVTIAVWARRHFGPGPAVLATFLFCTDPNFIAHGRYVTTDLIAALLIFLSCLTWGRFLRTLRRRDLVLAGITLGLALLSKFSALFLIPVLMALYLIRLWQAPDRYSLRHFAASILLLFLIGGLVVATAYWPESERALRSRDIESHAFWKGYEEVSKNYSEGRDSYLLGMHGKGWWYYYLVAFAVKTPTAVLLLLAITLAATFPSLRQPEDLRHLGFDWVLLVFPAAVYFALCISSRMDIGFRHLLPIFPFLFIAVSAGLWRWRQSGRALVCMIVVGVGFQTFEWIRIYPHYLSFFNSISGGPANGEQYLLDSNIDWGQDLKRLKRHLDAHHLPKGLCMCYFGRGLPRYYGMGDAPLPHTDEPEKIAALNCIAAISVTSLHDIYQQPGNYEWLRRRTPMGKVGYSIYLFDLRK